MTSHSLAVMDEGTAVQKLDAVVWGLLLIWIGSALLASLGWGVGLLGVGIILLCEQAARKYVSAKLETFWAIVGVVFVIGGITELMNLHVSLIPIACIVGGLALLVSALLDEPKP